MLGSPSATDLANHLACRHLTELDRAVAERRLAPPDWADPMTALLLRDSWDTRRVTCTW